jgi:hypothetical protein
MRDSIYMLGNIAIDHYHFFFYMSICNVCVIILILSIKTHLSNNTLSKKYIITDKIYKFDMNI